VKPGDLVLYTWPEQWSKVDDPMSWENARIGMIIDVSVSRPNDKIGDELLVMHEGERWSIPSSWCRLIKDPAHASGSKPVTMDS